MIKTLKIAFPIICLFILSSCNSHIEPEDLGRNVLNSFKKQDVEAGLSYILNEEDYRDFYSNSTLDNGKKEELIKEYTSPNKISELRKKFRKRFHKITEDGEKAGIVWKNVTFDYIEGPKLNKDLYGVQADEIYVFFSYNSVKYKLTLDDCFNCSRGWLMSDEPRLTKVSE